MHVRRSLFLLFALAASLTPALAPAPAAAQQAPAAFPCTGNVNIVRGEGDGKFDPADYMEFYGIGLDTAATNSRTYWLRGGQAQGQRIRPFASGPPAGAPAAARADTARPCAPATPACAGRRN